MSTFDTIIIGSGPGGYVAAIRAAQLGMKTACIEKDSTLGGTCLNIGCIPSKALLTSSEKFTEAREHLASHGVKVEGVSLDLDGMMRHKSKVVRDNTSGIEYLFKKNKVTHIKGYGTLKGRQQVLVRGGGREEVLTGGAVILATGSVYTSLGGVEVDEEDIVSSTGALSFKRVPESMIVIGGGYIGLEMGSVWARLGTKVTVIEFFDRILPHMDQEVSRNMLRILRKQGLEFYLSTKVLRAERVEEGLVEVVVSGVGDGGEEVLSAEKVLVAVGRRPFTEGLGLTEMGIETDKRGCIVTDGSFRTTVSGIFAIGDVIKGPMLAHKAEDEGVICVEMIAGQSGHIDYNNIPAVVFTTPEVAQVGKTEEELQAQGRSYKVGKFPFLANGRARALSATEGFAKILADTETDRILGVHILGADAGHLIAELALALEFSASSEDIARTCHAHPTLNEVVKEAALAVEKRALHI